MNRERMRAATGDPYCLEAGRRVEAAGLGLASDHVLSVGQKRGISQRQRETAGWASARRRQFQREIRVEGGDRGWLFAQQWP